MTLFQAALGALALCSCGMAALCLAMDRHYEQVTGRADCPVGVRRALRGLGAILLSVALIGCGLMWGGGVGVVLWFGFVSIGAMAVTLTLAWALALRG